MTQIDVHPEDSHITTFHNNTIGPVQVLPLRVSSPPRDPVLDNSWLDHSPTSGSNKREEWCSIQ
jgi:hypothetical protein